MLVNWFYEGVFHSVVERGSGVFVSVVLMGAQMCPVVMLGQPGVGGGHCPQRCCVMDPQVLFSHDVTVTTGKVGTRGFHCPVWCLMCLYQCLVLSLMFSLGPVFCTT